MQRHHLQTRRKDRFDIELICSDCHRCVHAFFTIKELRDDTLELHTIDGLRANEPFARALDYIKSVPPHRRVRTVQRRSARRRSRRRR